MRHDRLLQLLALVTWTAAVAIVQPGWSAALLLLAAMVLVPAALPLVGRSDGHLGLCLPALLLLAAFALPRGVAAGLLAGPWLVVTVAIAAIGLSHLRRRALSFPDLAFGIGCAYLAVGGTWAVISRLGLRPLDFSDAIVQATAVHFHYAGFLLPVLAGLAARQVHDTHARVTVLAVLLGVPLTAVGITLSALAIPWIELPAAWFMAGAGFLAAGLQFRLALREASLARQLLFLVSGLSLVFGMTLAGAYALGNFLGTPWLDIPAMAAAHGALNALGFAATAVLAHTLPKADAQAGLQLTLRSTSTDNEPVASRCV